MIFRAVSGGRRRILGIQLLALLPVTLAAIFNCGYQYYRGLAGLPGFDAGDFRSRLAMSLALDPQDPGFYDYLVTGLAHFVPMLLLALLVGVLVGPSLTNIVVIIALMLWSQFARMSRNETLRVSKLAYVDLAKTAGCPGWRIGLEHILPNVAGPLLVLATLQIGTVIIMEAALSFLGVGVPPPAPAWGSMIAEGRSYVLSAWWICIFPGLAILFTVMLANLLGEPGYAAGLIAKAAEFFLEHDRVEAATHPLQSVLLILGKEKLRISKARTNHALVTLGDDFGFTAVDIGDRNKMR